MREVTIAVTPKVRVTVRMQPISGDGGAFDVISSCNGTRLQKYECGEYHQAQETYNTIRDTLVDLSALIGAS